MLDNVIGQTVEVNELPSFRNLSEEWMTPKQLEDELSISIPLQERMRMRRRQMQDPNPLPFSKFGKSIFYNRKRISEWLLAREVDFKTNKFKKIS